jgi:hypothetical protein
LIDTAIRELLSEAGYALGSLSTPKHEVMTFENDTVLGFVLRYPDAKSLLTNWLADSNNVLMAAQFLLRRSDLKAWNVYFLILSDEPANYGQLINVQAIEENLVGTRKIARAGVKATEELRSALLPLLPVQNSPRLEPVDVPAEIRLRTGELPAEGVEAFLSDASEATVLQLLEAGQ